MQSKKMFAKQVMKDVLEVNRFEEYTSFVRDGPEYSARRLKHHVGVYLFQHKKVFAEIATNEAKKVMESLIPSLRYTTTADIKTGVLKLVRKLSNHLPYIDEEETNAEVMSCFENQERDVVLFYKYFASAFACILSAMKLDYEKMTSMSLELEKYVLKVLGEHLQGCTVRCPFCTATCSNPTKEHIQDHHTCNHYPVCLKTSDGQLSLKTCPEQVQLFSSR